MRLAPVSLRLWTNILIAALQPPLGTSHWPTLHTSPGSQHTLPQATLPDAPPPPVPVWVELVEPPWPP